MRVTEGTSFELSDGSWVKPTIELEETDYEQLLVDYGLTDVSSKISLVTKYQLLSAQAGLLIALNCVMLRRSESDWMETTGKPWLSAKQEAVAALVKKVKSAE